MRQARDDAARLRSALRHTLRPLAHNGTIDWISATVLATVSERSFPVCVMLAWSKAPYPQVLRISLAQVRSGRAIGIPARNGRVERYLAGRPVGGEDAWAEVDEATSWMSCDRESLQRDIARARRSCFVEPPPGLWDETELLRATARVRGYHPVSREIPALIDRIAYRMWGDPAYFTFRRRPCTPCPRR